MNEVIDPALVERMVALVRDMAPHFGSMPIGSPWWQHYDKAALIMDDLPAPPDPDIAGARDLAAEMGWTSEDQDYDSVLDLAHAAIKRGRELAGEGK